MDGEGVYKGGGVTWREAWGEGWLCNFLSELLLHGRGGVLREGGR